MRYILTVIYIFITGCVHDIQLTEKDTKLTRTPEYQREIDAILAEDTEIKKWERIYLREIAIAQENEDRDAYKFFIIEFIELPRLILPEWMKKEPGFTAPVFEAGVLRDTFRRISK